VTVDADIALERAALTKSLIAVGPAAPTACGDWTALDLAAHLVSEERLGRRPHLSLNRQQLGWRAKNPGERGADDGNRPAYSAWEAVLARTRR
jgi:hypothetical protein